MVEAKTQLLLLETKTTTKQKNSVEIEAYLKPSWVLASTNNNLVDILGVTISITDIIPSPPPVKAFPPSLKFLYPLVYFLQFMVMSTEILYCIYTKLDNIYLFDISLIHLCICTFN